MYVQILSQGYGNSKSLSMGLKKINPDIRIENLVGDARGTSRDIPDFLFLPGVGNFGYAIKVLESGGWDFYIKNLLDKGVVIVGICLGMQLMADSSEEAPGARGLGLVSGEVRRLNENISRVPNVGWRSIVGSEESTMSLWKFADRTFYFTHSFFFDVQQEQYIQGISHHGSTTFPAVIVKDNVIATQFHIEKSGQDGLDLLRWIIEK